MAYQFAKQISVGVGAGPAHPFSDISNSLSKISSNMRQREQDQRNAMNKIEEQNRYNNIMRAKAAQFDIDQQHRLEDKNWREGAKDRALALSAAQIDAAWKFNETHITPEQKATRKALADKNEYFKLLSNPNNKLGSEIAVNKQLNNEFNAGIASDPKDYGGKAIVDKLSPEVKNRLNELRSKDKNYVYTPDDMKFIDNLGQITAEYTDRASATRKKTLVDVLKDKRSENGDNNYLNTQLVSALQAEQVAKTTSNEQYDNNIAAYKKQLSSYISKNGDSKNGVDSSLKTAISILNSQFGSKQGNNKGKMIEAAAKYKKKYPNATANDIVMAIAGNSTVSGSTFGLSGGDFNGINDKYLSVKPNEISSNNSNIDRLKYLIAQEEAKKQILNRSPKSSAELLNRSIYTGSGGEVDQFGYLRFDGKRNGGTVVNKDGQTYAEVKAAKGDNKPTGKDSITNDYNNYIISNNHSIDQGIKNRTGTVKLKNNSEIYTIKDVDNQIELLKSDMRNLSTSRYESIMARLLRKKYDLKSSYSQMNANDYRANRNIYVKKNLKIARDDKLSQLNTDGFATGAAVISAPIAGLGAGAAISRLLLGKNFTTVMKNVRNLSKPFEGATSSAAKKIFKKEAKNIINGLKKSKLSPSQKDKIVNELRKQTERMSKKIKDNDRPKTVTKKVSSKDKTNYDRLYELLKNL